MRALLTPLLLVLVSSSALAQRLPEELVSDFYTARLASPSLGVPSGRELAELSMYMGPELVCVLGAALRYNEKFLEKHPEASPLFADSDLYSSQLAKPQRFTRGRLLLAKSGASVPVQFYRDETDTQGWQDVVHLKMVRKRWAIADVQYQGGAGFANQGTLFNKLREQLTKASPVEGWSAGELEACSMDSVAPAKSKAKHKGKGKSAAKSHSKSSAKSHSKSASKGKVSGKSKSQSSKKKH